ncbi:unnamed protein product [Paramecium sonneborni]|uniref:Aminotransferase class I/classII large domain-containing protein n=1 Tax=Paramecium sonneborni TaxID=65129 RepID=A0A8S1MFN2_9CILI|nr:unnamed protein product [Paramecium sonneborni]
MQPIANRMLNYLQPQMYAKFTMLANQKGCINLGQGFPNFPSPQMLRDALSEEAQTESLQYTMTAGHPKLLNSASQFFEKQIGCKFNVDKEIMVSSGAQAVLSCVMQGVLNPGDEVILFDPAFDLYRPMIEFQGAKHIGVPIIPKKLNAKQDILKRYKNGKFDYSNDDDWNLDFNYLERVINKKTKLVLLNSPMNPIGKMFSTEEYNQLADILDRYPQVVVCEDAAYHHITFGQYQPFNYPRCITHPRLKDRTVCVTSAGKMYSATGLRIGFAVGNEEIIKGLKAAQTYHIFCLNPVIQTATAKCLDQTQDGKYFNSIRDLYEEQANMLLKGLVDSRLNMNYWVPQGGYFIVTDISNIQIPEKYFNDNGVRLTRDFAFAYYMINEFGVVCIPCSPYYENKQLGQNYVRWAFCKTTETIQEAINRLK